MTKLALALIISLASVGHAVGEEDRILIFTARSRAQGADTEVVSEYTITTNELATLPEFHPPRGRVPLDINELLNILKVRLGSIPSESMWSITLANRPVQASAPPIWYYLITLFPASPEGVNRFVVLMNGKVIEPQVTKRDLDPESQRRWDIQSEAGKRTPENP